MAIHTVQTTLANKNISFETGKIATQAHGSAVCRMGDTVVLSTAVMGGERAGIDFLPLSVDYLERTFAAGKIPGGYFRREGRPTEKEIITSRLIDRPIRPMFPDGYFKDTQVVATVLQFDQAHDPDVVGVNASACALLISPLPFTQALGCVRVGRVDGQYVINPTNAETDKSDLDMIVVAKRDAIVMVEGSAKYLSEEQVLEALFLAHDSIRPILDMQEELLHKIKPDKFIVKPREVDAGLRGKISSHLNKHYMAAMTIPKKQERRDARHKVLEDLDKLIKPEGTELAPGVDEFIENEERRLVREMVIKQKKRLDGRGLTDIRPITCEIGVLPRTHGSALFTRGETQALVVTTLGSATDEQRIDALEGELFKSFMLHYNFPPFSVGEVKPLRSPARREIGHGVLAERAVRAVIPESEKFPYTIRIVSDILESNGSSSMATVCGSTLSLMDAGVPIKAAVAGIAMGLIAEGNDVAILTDILGDEDHLGDMDFKVAGTESGVTAIQMDIKIDGLKREVLADALRQARDARMRILDTMKQTIAQPRESLSQYAPRIFTLQINPEKIRFVIGPGGKNIKSIIEKTNVQIDIENSGAVNIFSTTKEAADEAIALIREAAQDFKVDEGAVIKGLVERIENYGAFVQLMPGLTGLLHISELDVRRVDKVTDIVKEGDQIEVKVLAVEPNGRIRLSRRALLEGGDAPRDGDRSEGGGGTSSRFHSPSPEQSGGGGDRPPRPPRRDGPPRGGPSQGEHRGEHQRDRRGPSRS